VKVLVSHWPYWKPGGAVANPASGLVSTVLVGPAEAEAVSPALPLLGEEPGADGADQALPIFGKAQLILLGAHHSCLKLIVPRLECDKIRIDLGRVQVVLLTKLRAVRGVAEHRMRRAALLELRPDGGAACLRDRHAQGGGGRAGRCRCAEGESPSNWCRMEPSVEMAAEAA
jgi:hypothetical protein